jgi:dihydrofolate synthase / folylpolyglutamate synthase
VCAMLGDKAVAETLRALDTTVDHWMFAGLPGPRGREAGWMAAQAAAANLRGTLECAEDVAAAVARAVALAGDDDRVLVFGSFLTAGAALAYLDAQP